MRSTTLRASLHALALWSLLLSLSFAPHPAAAGSTGCLTRLIQLSLGAEEIQFCAPTALPSNLVKDDHDPEAAYAQLNQLGGYGILNIKSLAPGAGTGPGRPVYRGQSAAEYLRQVQDIETHKPDRSVSEDPATLWGETVRGIAIQTPASASTGGMSLHSVEWYVERDGRLWVFLFAWDAGLPNAQEWQGAAQAFAIQPSGPFTGPDAAIDLGEALLRSQPSLPHPSESGSELVDVGTPSWWSGVCNDGNYFLKDVRPHSFPLGASFRGVPACGPRPYTVSTPDHLVSFFPEAWGQYEFECVELVMRFLYQQWAIAPWSGNGNTIKNSPPASLTFYPNGTHAISPGDVLTEDGTASNAFGHAALITSVNLDETGTGTITILEENSDPDGARALNVIAWEVQPDAWIHSQVIQGWLHHRTTDRVSVSSEGAQAAGESVHPAISADGRYVAFESAASDLSVGDTNGFRDIFLRDRDAGGTALISLAPDGSPADGNSFAPDISADGRYVAYESLAANLVVGDTNSARDVFVYDRIAGTTARVSVASGGAQVSGDSGYASISSDGRYVAFESDSSGLVPGDTNTVRDVFVHDTQTGDTLRLSVAAGGGQANGASSSPDVSAGGRYVAFESAAANLVSGDTNSARDIFVYDRVAGTTARVSVASGSAQADGPSYFPSISADGLYAAFESTASNIASGDTNGLRDVFVHDLQAGVTQRMSLASDGGQADGESRRASISDDGRQVAFVSAAGDLVTGDTNGLEDVFIHNRLSGTTSRASLTSGGGQADGPSGQFSASLSADGRFLAFDSAAANLVDGDTNAVSDVFVRDNGVSLLTISGDAGAAGVTLSFNDGASRTALSAADGSYSLQVPAGWSGRITPSKTGYTFTPDRRTYSGLAADQFSQDYTASTSLKVTSTGAEDGWLLESSETSNQGGSMDATAITFNLGDDAENKQYRALLSFNTAALPDDAVIERVTLKIRRAGISGTNPFSTHMGLKVDIRKLYFGMGPGLVIQDFQAAASKLAVGTFSKIPSTDWWYTAVLGSAAYPYLNVSGTTQLRLRYLRDDDNDLVADYLKFYSGNAFSAANRPVLTIWYHVP